MELHERLKQARLALGQTIAEAALRSGVNERHAGAMEEGRFAELPRGIYARAALRAYASSLGFDTAEILDAGAALLPAVEDPIRAIARLRGLRISRSEENHPLESPAVLQPRLGSSARKRAPDWRIPVAAVIDACTIGVTLLTVIVSATLMTGLAPASLHGSAGAFVVMGVLLGASYFLWLAGVLGLTAGERWVGYRSSAASTGRATLNLRTIVQAAARSGAAEARFVLDLGEWTGEMSVREAPTVSSSEAAEGQQPAIAR